MKRRRLSDPLAENGCEFDRSSANHDKYVNTSTGKKTAVPDHNEIDNDLAKEIRKQLGIPVIR